MKFIGFIFARSGSKGLPGKNIKDFSGKPLIAWSIEQAIAIQDIERLIVSTDSPEIAKIAVEYGAEVPFLRPLELAADNTPEILAWRHALYYVNNNGESYDAMVSIPATSPLRLSSDIQKCIDLYRAKNADVVVTFSAAARNPYFNMVKINEEGLLNLANSSNKVFSRRQDVPVVYDLTTVAYVVNSEFILKHDSIFEGSIFGVEIPPERSVDIDTQLDFDFAEFLFNRNIKKI
jgi:CMP-N-acetylneuraminic acid synthetase